MKRVNTFRPNPDRPEVVVAVVSLDDDGNGMGTHYKLQLDLGPPIAVHVSTFDKYGGDVPYADVAGPVGDWSGFKSEKEARAWMKAAAKSWRDSGHVIEGEDADAIAARPPPPPPAPSAPAAPPGAPPATS